MKTSLSADLAQPSHTTRWSGATRRPVSVAEHALFVVEILERDFAVRDPLLLFAALHHDSAEAYTGDLSRPLKDMLSACGVELDTYTAPIERAVRAHFGIADAKAEHPLIKRADTMALGTEWRDLMPPEKPQPPRLTRPDAVDWIDLRQRAGMDADDWRLAFLDKHLELAMRCEGAAAGAPADDGISY